MSPPINSIGDFLSRGGKIWVENGTIRLRAPKGALRSAEIDHIRSAKPEILSDLRLEDCCCRCDFYPLTGTQSMPWFMTDTLQPRVRTMPMAFRITGDLNVAALESSIRRLRRRHDVLRAKLGKIGDIAGMLVLRDDSFQLTTLKLETTRREEAAQASAQDFINQIVDPRVDALFDCTLIRLSARYHWLVVSIDHVISDELSNELLTRDLWAAYESHEMQVSNLDVAKPPQFTEYAAWLRSFFPTWEHKNASYWRRRLGDAPPLPWPTASAGGSASTHCSGVDAPISACLSAHLTEFCKIHRIGLPILVLSAFAATVSLCHKQDDITVTFVDSGRSESKLVSMIGCLSCHLHLRFRNVRSQTFSEFLASVMREFIGASERRDFDWLPSILPQLNTDLYFNWVPYTEPVPAEHIGELLIDRPTPLVPDRSLLSEIIARVPYKLSLLGSHTEAGVTAGFAYRQQFISNIDIELLITVFERVLWKMVRDPSSHITCIGTTGIE